MSERVMIHIYWFLSRKFEASYGNYNLRLNQQLCTYYIKWH